MKKNSLTQEKELEDNFKGQIITLKTDENGGASMKINSTSEEIFPIRTF